MCFLNTYKVKIDLAGLEASLTGDSKQITMPYTIPTRFKKTLQD
ncbi:hypothetical protein AREALGSMS7_02164 [Arenibacter algicola]|jgi:hypothetical protein|uniref:Uncharacterized protein n=1 Tax=Arenibacter algicola TaxID=616991 RepID=A0A221UXJ8_9FLAO|nr:hypothetical protein AREALGSMS7_02164 [Arenibacter algicola]